MAQNTLARHAKKLIDGVMQHMLPLAVMIGSMVYTLACSIDIGSVCENHFILPKLIFSLSLFHFAVMAIRENSKVCFALTLLGLPGAVVVIKGGLQVFAQMPEAGLGFVEMADIACAMIVTLPFVLLAGSLAIMAWGEGVKLAHAIGGIFRKST